MHHSEIINLLIEKYDYESYLEIGIFNTADNYDKITCNRKAGVDPEYAGQDETIFKGTSDEFFNQNTTLFDIVFVDGLHEKEQVIRDIENSMKWLKGDGTIVVHDCLPESELMQRVPRETQEWTGDVWRAMLHFRKKENLSIVTVDTDYGVGLIQRGKQEPIQYEENITYGDFLKSREALLNIITIGEFLGKFAL